MRKINQILVMIMLLMGCEQPKKTSVANEQSVTAKNQEALPDVSLLNEEANQVKSTKETLPLSAFMTAEWIDLLPKDDLEALLNPPDYLNEITDGSVEDQLTNSLNNTASNTTDKSEDDRYEQALVSTRVITTIDNVAIKIPAFIVPLEFDDEQNVTQFFMVPYFGACMHFPPPPPNQTIFVKYPQGFKLASLAEPYWISGILTTSTVKNELATAAYSMEMHHATLYLESE